jgi:hypothetical protein
LVFCTKKNLATQQLLSKTSSPSPTNSMLQDQYLYNIDIIRVCESSRLKETSKHFLKNSLTAVRVLDIKCVGGTFIALRKKSWIHFCFQQTIWLFLWPDLSSGGLLRY